METTESTNTLPKISLQYDADRDSFYIDCGSLENANKVLNLFLFATEMATKK